MRAWPLAMALLLGCSNAPEVVSLGEFESPCTSSDDCFGEPCLILDGFGTCTESCAESRTCRSGYTCDTTQGACVPSPAGMCRDDGQRCGPHFARCCEGYGCVEFDDWGPRCAPVGCNLNDPLGCGNGFCCVAAGPDTVCAPPTYCE